MLRKCLLHGPDTRMRTLPEQSEAFAKEVRPRRRGGLVGCTVGIGSVESDG